MAPVALITGATGLIGSHLLRRWALPDITPVALSSADDLLEPGAASALVDRVAPLVVVHLAWTASGTPGYRDDARNAAWVAASLELAEACAARGAWFVGTGTAVDSVTDPADAYTAAKVRLRAALAARIGSGACTWIRPYYVVDPDLRRPALLAEALRARDAGQVVRLRTPDSRHDFVHALDVADAVQTTVASGLRGEVPVGAGTTRTVTDLMAALGVTWEADHGAPHRPPARGQLHQAADIRLLHEHGWRPTHTEEMFASA